MRTALHCAAHGPSLSSLSHTPKHTHSTLLPLKSRILLSTLSIYIFLSFTNTTSKLVGGGGNMDIPHLQQM